jgi:photosystem II stability/assembly factor-like uncharacterized protein
MRKHFIQLLIVFELIVSLPFKAQGQWEQSVGIDGGSVKAFGVDGTNLYAASDGGGIFLSTDTGKTWKLDIYSLKCSFTSYFDTTASNIFAVSNQEGILRRSRTAGSHWSECDSGLKVENIYSFAVLGTKIFAGTKYGLFRSTNEGTNWTTYGSGLPGNDSGLPGDGWVSKLAAVGSNLVAITSDSGMECIFYSSDTGASWKKTDSGLPVDCFFGALVRCGAKLFVGTNSGIYRSDDGGLSWVLANGNLGYVGLGFCDEKGNKIFTTTHTQGGLYFSTDNGENWNPTDSVLDDYILSMVSFGSKLFAGLSSGGISVSSDNGTSWKSSISGLSNIGVDFFTQCGNYLFARTCGKGILRSSDDGYSWSVLDAGINFHCVNSMFSIGNDLFAGTLEGGLYRSNDNGMTWTYSDLGLGTRIRSIVKTSDLLFTGTEGGDFISRDNGVSWTQTNKESVFGILATVGENIFVGTKAGIYISRDNGKTWSDLSKNIISKGIYDLEIQALVSSESTIFAAGRNVVYTSIDTGANWSIVDSGFTKYSITSLLASGSNLYVGTLFSDTYLFTKSNGRWVRRNLNMPAGSADCLIEHDNYLLAGTRSNGVQRLPLSSIDTKKRGGDTRNKFNCSIKIPSQISHTGYIKFNLPRPERIKIDIFNLSGMKMTPVVDKAFTEGEHILTWNAGIYHAGYYTMKIRYGSYSFIKSILIVR